MKKFILVVLGLSLSMFLFIICNNASTDKSLSLKKSNFSIIENEEFFINNPKEELKGNIYVIQDKSKQYMVFYQMNINPNDIEISIEDSVIKINLTDDDNYEDIYVYEIRNYENYEDYTLKIMKNNKEMVIDAIII